MSKKLENVEDERATTRLDLLTSAQTDWTGAKVCEISIREDGKIVWINVEGVCLLRVCRIENLVLDDRRKKK